MGVVYEAYDRENAQSVALKLLPLAVPDLLLRFKREFRAVADVRHQNLVRLGDLVSEGAQWFFTMELVRGTDLLSYIRGADPGDAPTAPAQVAMLPGAEGTLTLRAPERAALAAAIGAHYREDRLRATMAQLAQGLAALHAAGCVHRDVKPRNVLVTAAGRLVLLDFGLASSISAETTVAGAGTPEYMAPEQVGETVGPAADWYALGTVLFEVLTGRLPFEGAPHTILYDKTSRDPPRVADYAKGAPADLAALCDRLLAREPGARPGQAEVLAMLAPAAASAGGPRPADELPLLFVGRQKEQEELSSALAEVRAGSGARAVVLRGESGVGKSTLVRAFLEAHAGGSDTILLTARCYERELVPFKAVDGLVDALARHLGKSKRDAASVEARLPRRAAVLLQTFPVLGRIEAIARAPYEVPATDPREVRAAMFAVLRELLTVLAGDRPAVAFIDDLQWADADSLALLAEILRSPDAPRLLLIATLRSTAADGGAAAPLLGGTAPERMLVVDNLPEREALALARDLLRVGEAGLRLAPAGESADLLARESGGHPLFLRELARTLHLRTAGEPRLTLDGVLRAQIEAFPAPTVRALRALAIASAPVSVRALGEVLAAERGTMLEIVDELRGVKLVQSVAGRGDDMVDIAHDRIRQVARATVSPDEARELHELLATAFENTGDSLRAAGHWREAGHSQQAARHFAEAAERAAAALAFDRAAQHFEAALSLGDWPPDRRDALKVGLADALANAGRGAAAAAHYLEVAERGNPDRSLELRRRGAEELLRSGLIDAGRDAAEKALARAGLSFARAPLRALLWQRALLRVRGRRFRWRTAQEIVPRDLARVDLCWSLSSGLGLMDPVQGAHFQVRSLLLALRAGEPYRVARGIAGEAAYAAAQGEAQRSKQLLDEATGIAKRIENPHADGIVALMSGMASHLLGEFRAGVEHLEAASGIFRDRCVGTAWELDAARHFAVECLYYLGELGRFRSAAAEGLRQANERGSVYAATTLRTGLANAVWLLDDDPARAGREAAEAMRDWSSSGYHIQHWYGVIARAQIALYEGRAAEAHAGLEEAWPHLRRSHLLQMQHTRIVALHLRARATLAAATASEGDARAEGLALARWCAERLGREGRGWGPALGALILAGVLDASGDRARSAEQLRLAIQETHARGLGLLEAAAQVVAGEAHGDETAGGAGGHFMREHAVKAPAALTRMLVPGFGSAKRI